jgi:WD40 repeat protein
MLMTISTTTTSLWDAESGRLLAPPLPAGGQLLFEPLASFGAALSRDGMRVVTKEPFGGNTRLWDAATGNPLGPLCPVEGVPEVASDDGSIIVTGATAGLRVWDLIAGVERSPYHPFVDAREVVARSYDGRKMLVRLPDARGRHGPEVRRDGRGAGRYQLLDAISALPAGEPFTLDENTAGVALGPDGRILLAESMNQDGNAAPQIWSRIHDASSGRAWGQRLPGSTIAFSPDGEIVVVGSSAWRIPIANVDDRRLPSDRPVRLVAFMPGGKTVVTVAEGSDLSRWDLATGRCVHRDPSRAGRSALCLSLDGRLAVMEDGQAARLLDVETGHDIGTPLDHPKPVTLAAFAPDGKNVVTSEGSTIRIWDCTTGHSVSGPKACQGQVVAVALGPTGMVYVEESPVPHADWGHRHVVWKDIAGKRVIVPEQEPGGVVSFSPDGRHLYIGGQRSGRLWDVSEDPPRAKPSPGKSQGAGDQGIKAAAFGPGGRIYAIAREDGTIEVRETATNRRIGPARSPDQRIAVPPGSEPSQRVADEGLRPKPAEAIPTAVSFSTDGHTLLIGFDDGQTRFWAIPLIIPEDHLARWLERRTAVELRGDLSVRALDRDELLKRWSELGDLE